jgi:RNA polymerase sigma-70 factor (ECF subfamily)
VTKPDEQRLLSDLHAARPEACAELVRGHYRAVYRFLVHLTGDVHEAEDLTQETFAAAWEKITAFAGRSSLATWLHRIAYTKFVDCQRAKERSTRLLQRLTKPVADTPDPLGAVLANDEVQQLSSALQELDSAERVPLILHYLQGLSYREMAAVLDEPVGTMKWRTATALEHLRTLLSEKDANHAPRKTSEPGPVS